MKADFPTERWFWFDPPFHRNQSVLLHQPGRQRLPHRLPARLAGRPGAREEARERDPAHPGDDRRRPRVRARVGQRLHLPVPPHEPLQPWPRAVRGRSAHQVSPFGARGANSGIQDADNLVWKLELVMDGKAPATLLDTYGAERGYAADENIMNSTRSTDFITPKSRTSKTFRNAVLEPGRAPPLCARAGQLRAPVGAQLPRRFAAEHRRRRGVRRQHGARRADGRCPRSRPPTASLAAGRDGDRFQVLHYVADAADSTPPGRGAGSAGRGRDSA